MKSLKMNLNLKQCAYFLRWFTKPNCSDSWIKLTGAIFHWHVCNWLYWRCADMCRSTVEDLRAWLGFLALVIGME